MPVLTEQPLVFEHDGNIPVLIKYYEKKEWEWLGQKDRIREICKGLLCNSETDFNSDKLKIEIAKDAAQKILDEFSGLTKEASYE